MKVTKLRELNTEKIGPAGAEYVSAASGIVRLGDLLYVVPDDELMLAIFKYGSPAPGIWFRLFGGELPKPHEERKRKKPDLESIVFIPPHQWAENGALLVVPSGSKPNRIKGSLVSLSKTGVTVGSPVPVDFGQLYARLAKDIPQLNIEGAVFLKDKFLLLNRGDGSRGKNVIVSLNREKLLRELHDTHVLTEDLVMEMKSLELGEIGGCNLSFTDGCALPDGRMVYSAAAEDTDDPYLDGPCKGSVIGVMSAAGDLVSSERIDFDGKVEGVHATLEGDQIDLLLVTDADSESIPSVLLSASWRPDSKRT